MQWCIPKVSGEFVAAMEDVLELYAEPYDAARPVVCFDEISAQLLADVRPPEQAAPARTWCPGSSATLMPWLAPEPSDAKWLPNTKWTYVAAIDSLDSRGFTRR